MKEALACNFLCPLAFVNEKEARKGSWLMLCGSARFIKDEADPIECEMLSQDSFSILALVKKMLGFCTADFELGLKLKDEFLLLMDGRDGERKCRADGTSRALLRFVSW